MNIYKFLILFSIIFLASLRSYSQNNINIHVVALYDSDESHVKIRWAPENMNVWNMGLESGYTLLRYTYFDGTDTIHVDSFYQNIEILDSNIMHLPEIEWANIIADTNVIGFAQAAIFEDSLELEFGENTSEYLNARNKMDAAITRFNFGMLAADRSFEVAKAMGLGFVDSNIVTGAVYEYVVLVNNIPFGSNINLNGYRIAIDTLSVNMPAPVLVNAESRVTSISLFWEVSKTNGAYLGYDLERSDDLGLSYTRINEVPIVSLLNETDTSFVFNYLDPDVPEYDKVYVYRVKGIDLWEREGVWSDTLHVYNKPPSIDVSPSIISISELETSFDPVVFVEWSFPDSLENKIQKFRVYRSSKSIDKLVLYEDDIPVSSRTWIDEAPGDITYYKVGVLDNTGLELVSYVKLFQIKDTIPPSVPEGLAGSCGKDGTIQVSWSPSPEDDLLGYRVFSTYNQNGEWKELTTDFIEDTSLVFVEEIYKLNKFIYIKVQASDFRGNYSEYSDTLELAIPDIVPPSPPVLYSLGQYPFGQLAQFRSSGSDDVVHHIIERQNVFEGYWMALDTIIDWATSGMFTATNEYEATFIDTGRLQSVPYHYRILAEDDSGNKSVSKTVEIIPHQLTNRPDISLFTVDTFQVSSTTFGCLRWDYESMDQFQDFVIYRKINNFPMKAYIATQGTLSEVEDNWPGIILPVGAGEFVFADLLLDDEGNLYDTGYPVESVVYKIMARHYDGSTSPYSIEIQITFD